MSQLQVISNNQKSLEATDPRFARNLGFWTLSEQHSLCNAKVGIAGAGGGGGVAAALVRMGIGTGLRGEIRLADPDVFEIENINRQEGCFEGTLGKNKAAALADYLQTINPFVHTTVYANGITSSNVTSFIDDLDLLIDETDIFTPVIGVQLAREARKKGVPSLMVVEIGFGAVVTSFHPNGHTFEAALGLSPIAPIDEIRDAIVDVSKWLPYLPPYIDTAMLKKVYSGNKPAPSMAPGIEVAHGLASSQVFLHLTRKLGNKRREPIFAPRHLLLDPMAIKAKVINWPTASYLQHLVMLQIKNKLGAVPKAGY